MGLYWLGTVDFELQTSNFQLPTVNFQLPTANCKLQTVNCQRSFRMPQSFRDLLVWQKSMVLVEAIYRLTRSFPKDELYGLTSQMRRASVSLASNIAEGSGRLSGSEFLHFLSFARGSNQELQTQLEVAKRLEFGNLAEIEAAEAQANEIGRMLFALIEKVRSTVGK